MSIRTPFNPMGTLGAEMPYVQPVYDGETLSAGIPATTFNTQGITYLVTSYKFENLFRTILEPALANRTVLKGDFVFSFAKPIYVSRVESISYMNQGVVKAVTPTQSVPFVREGSSYLYAANINERLNQLTLSFTQNNDDWTRMNSIRIIATYKP